MPSKVTAALLVAVLLPPIVALSIVYRQSLPVPYQDDYGTILAFAVRYVQLPTLKAKVIDIATIQSNEYKLGFEHAVVAGELELTHHLNFAFLTALGNLFLFPLGYLLWRIYREDSTTGTNACWRFCPLAYCSSRSLIGKT